MKTIAKKPIEDIFSRKKKEKNSKPEENKKIIIDYREKNSLVPSQLKKLDFETEFKELKVADYIIKDVAIERKTISDFVSSMMNQRLLKQLEELQQYKNKLLIIEGIEEDDLYNDKEYKGVNSNAIRGFILSITLKHKVPIIYTKNEEDTAKYIDVITKKQNKETRLNPQKKTLDRKEQLQFVIESFPGVGPKTAKKLLEKFGSIKNIILADGEQLEEILGKKTETVRDIIERSYDKKPN